VKKQAAQEIITSRLLVLQSKRLMLNTTQRRLDESGLDSLRSRVETLRMEADHAQHLYRSTLLAYGSPEHAEYWVVAYSRLIEMGNALKVRLHDAVLDLPLSERYQASADVEMLEEIVARWHESMRAAMTRSVA
jgi:propanediol dehydratase small subunit